MKVLLVPDSHHEVSAVIKDRGHIFLVTGNWGSIDTITQYETLFNWKVVGTDKSLSEEKEIRIAQIAEAAICKKINPEQYKKFKKQKIY